MLRNHDMTLYATKIIQLKNEKKNLDLGNLFSPKQ